MANRSHDPPKQKRILFQVERRPNIERAIKRANLSQDGRALFRIHRMKNLGVHGEI